MSTTSTKSDRYKVGQGSRNKDRKQSSHGSIQRYKIGQGSRKKWSNGKVLDELSSFIAEFSYLTDTPNASEEERQRTPLHSHQVYAAHTDDNNKRGFNKVTNSPSNDIQGKSHKKSVEWKDHRRNSPVQNENRYRNQHKTDISDFPDTTSGDEKLPSTYSRKHHKVPSAGRLERHPIAFISRNREGNKRSRSRSKRRVIKKSRSRDGHKPPRSQSDHSYKVRRRQRSDHSHKVRFRQRSDHSHKVRRRRRSRSSKSWVKYMPLKYERKKSKENRVIVKTRPPIPIIRKTEIKGTVPSHSQTIITLYPNKYPDPLQCQYTCDPEFLADSALPCKCFNCKRKYESLMKVVTSPHRLGDINTRAGRVRKKQLRNHVQRPDFCNDTEVCQQNSPCVECLGPVHNTYNYCERFGNTCCKNVYFRFDCFGQYLDSNITQYFHSILNDTIYC